MPGVVDPELYTRWVQFGAFSPILRTHTTKNQMKSAASGPAHPRPYSSILRSTFQLRYALEPYTYTEARKTYDTGVAFLHPLYYDWPNDPPAYGNKGEYVFGDQMIAAPVNDACKISGLYEANRLAAQGRLGSSGPPASITTGPTTQERAFFIRPGSRVSSRRRHRPHAAAHALHRPKASRSAHPQYLAARARRRFHLRGLRQDSRRRCRIPEESAAAHAPIKAHAADCRDTLKVEIGGASGSYPGMRASRATSCACPATGRLLLSA